MIKRNKISSGLQNQRVEFFKQNNTTDGYGGLVSENTSYWQTSANVSEFKVNKTFEAYQDKLKNSFLFSVRFREDKGVAVDDLILYRGNYYVVKDIETDFINKVFINIIASYNGKG